MTRGTRLWLNKVQGFQYKPKETQWTMEEYVMSWHGMKELTSSLPGPAFSHYKAAQFDSLAAQVHSDLALFPLITGYSPKGWRHAVASMIPKKKFNLCTFYKVLFSETSYSSSTRPTIIVIKII